MRVTLTFRSSRFARPIIESEAPAFAIAAWISREDTGFPALSNAASSRVYFSALLSSPFRGALSLVLPRSGSSVLSIWQRQQIDPRSVRGRRTNPLVKPCVNHHDVGARPVRQALRAELASLED